MKACWSLFTIRITESLQYRMAALASGSISVFWALIEIVVFTIFYKYGNLQSASALTLAQTISYVWIAQSLVMLQPMAIDNEIRTMIINGDVGVELCRPLDLYFHWFSKTAAGRLGGGWWRGLITIAAGLLVPASMRLGGPASAAGFLLFLLSLVSAFVLCTAFGMLNTAIRLGVAWGDGPTFMLMLVGGVLSGSYLPLQLWPDFMQKFLLFQPFAGYLDIPVRLYVGSMPPSAAALGIALQIGWSAVFILLGRAIMAQKLKNIVVQGG